MTRFVKSAAFGVASPTPGLEGESTETSVLACICTNPKWCLLSLMEHTMSFSSDRYSTAKAASTLYSVQGALPSQAAHWCAPEDMATVGMASMSILLHCGLWSDSCLSSLLRQGTEAGRNTKARGGGAGPRVHVAPATSSDMLVAVMSL